MTAQRQQPLRVAMAETQPGPVNNRKTTGAARDRAERLGALRCALDRDRARCRSRDARACHPHCADRVFLFTISNSVVFFVPVARCCARVSPSSSLAAFAEASAGMSAEPLPLRARPDRGAEERREAVSSFRRARKARHHVCETRPSGANRNGPRGAPPGGFGPAPRHPASAVACGSRCAGDLRCRVSRPVGRRSRTSRARFTSRGRDATPPLRLQDRLRRRPSMSEDDES